MKNILASSNREVLRQFARAGVLLAFDYDGTLAPIVARPQRAVMRAVTRRLLKDLARLYTCIVISGRARPDAVKRLRGVRIHEILGNHGVEPWHAAKKLTAEVRRWRPLLENQLAAQQGVTIEDKGYSVAVHYRRSSEKTRARAAIVKAAGLLGEVRVISGKQVVDIVSHSAPHKGIALERARARLRCDAAIYVGDDETDEDVFALDEPGRLLSIRVGQRRSSSSSYFIENQRRIDELLRALLRLRQDGGLARTSGGGRPRAVQQ